VGPVEVVAVVLLLAFVKKYCLHLASEEVMGVQVVLTHEKIWYAMVGEVGEDEELQHVMAVQVAPKHEMTWYAMVGEVEEVGEDEGLPCDVYELWMEMKKPKSYFEEEEEVVGAERVVFAALELFVKSWGSKVRELHI
jgi:hypothetical protein